MANLPTYTVDSSAVTARALEVPAASWDTGMNFQGSCAPGIGIATDNAGLDESLPNWTLTDQDAASRTPQVSQVLGGAGFVDRTTWDETSGGVAGKGTDPVNTATNPANVVDADAQGDVPDNDAPPVDAGDAHLVSLAVGWVEV